jgi:hypothetical protein
VCFTSSTLKLFVNFKINLDDSCDEGRSEKMKMERKYFFPSRQICIVRILQPNQFSRSQQIYFPE